jgi:purine-binding chemotaxis protein CheW
MPDVDAPITRGGEKRRFLTFHAGERLYALPVEEVLEVIPTPSVARIPGAPPSMLGIANLRGTAISVASLNGLLGRETTKESILSRAIVLDGSQRVAVAVDAIKSFVSVDLQVLDTDGSMLAAEGGEHLAGAFRLNEAVVRILDIGVLLARAFVKRPALTPAPTVQRPGHSAAAPAIQSAPWIKYVVFAINGQLYALEADMISEIVSAPALATVVPQTEAVVLGLMPYRGGILPLLVMSGLLGLSARDEAGPDEKVIVTRVKGALVGLLVDRAHSIVSADPALLEPLPAMLAARAGGESRVKAIYRGGEGGGLISILASDKLFRESIMQQLSAREASQPQARDGPPEQTQRAMLAFKLGSEEFALPVDCVEEVALVPDNISRIPKAPKFLDGVINHRGNVLPVIDQARRFDMAASMPSPGRRLVIIQSRQHRAALVVTSVSEILHISDTQLQPPPDVTGQAMRYVEGVVNLHDKGRIIFLLNPGELLSDSERSRLNRFSGGQGPVSS